MAVEPLGVMAVSALGGLRLGRHMWLHNWSGIRGGYGCGDPRGGVTALVASGWVTSVKVLWLGWHLGCYRCDVRG